MARCLRPGTGTAPAAFVPDRPPSILAGALQHSYEDTAAMCGVRVGTVKSRLNRGGARLAELLDIEAADTIEPPDQITSAIVARNGPDAG